MIDKLLTFPGRTEQGIFTHVIGEGSSQRYLEKTASAQYHPTIGAYINAAKKIPGQTQVLLTALGSYEYWGDNVNGDAFPERGLAYSGKQYGHKTFEYYSHVYKHHINKDPNKSYGTVALSVYNPVYHRVELIVHIDELKAPDIVQKIDNGEYPEWSMGTRVPYDRCSVCNNKAPTRDQYCDHARFMMGQIDPETGKKVFVFNDFPRFHDISQVLIGADKIAKTLMKVASVTTESGIHLIGSAAMAEKNAAKFKSASIEKEVPASGPPASERTLKQLSHDIPEMKALESNIPEQTLNTLGNYPIASSMSTMASLGILPKPQEFQRIFLISMGQKPLADHLSKRNMCFDPEMMCEPQEKHERILGLDHNKFNTNIMDLLKSIIPERSYSAPHLARRILIMVKHANEIKEDLPIFLKTAEEVSKVDWDKMNSENQDGERKPIGLLPMLMAAAGLYAAFAKKAPDEAVKGVDKLIMKNPGLAAALGVGVATTFGSMLGKKRQGNFSHGSYVNPDSSDVNGYAKRHIENPVMKTASMAELGRRTSGSLKRLFVGIPAVYLGSGILQKHRDLNPYGQEGKMKSFARKNPDLLSGALIADALLASRGKGTYGISKRLTPKFKSLVGKLKTQHVSNPIQKTANVGEILADTARSIAYPLAVGGSNLPYRTAGGMLDQGVLKGVDYVLSKRKAKQAKQ